MAEGATLDNPSGASSIQTSSAQGTPTSSSPLATTRVVDFLKPDSPRKRRRSGEDSNPSLAKPVAPAATTAPISPKFRVSPPTLTAAQALIDQRKQKQALETTAGRQTSPNPAIAALGALQGKPMISEKGSRNVLGIVDQASEPMATNLSPSPETEGPKIAVAQMQQNLTPSSTFAQVESAPPANVLDGSSASVASPGRIDENLGNEEDGVAHTTAPATAHAHPDGRRLRRQETDPGEARSDKALTYPGPLPNFHQVDRRRNTHSGFGHDGESKSPSSTKKHQCPYCTTTFTRHHNLKSHLLTHSHEKPYYCDTCDSRFRRLHDLKRHSKLHTGERPHTCPKCHRSFARGDALARHSKGAGGCAGRRSSLGGDDPEQDEAMQGLMYTGEASHEPERMDDDADMEGSRKGSLPSIKKHEAPKYSASDGQVSYTVRQPSTYPPILGRQSNPGGLYPPMASPGGGSSTSNSPRQASFTQHSGSSTFQSPTPTQFAQGGGITESPKPLSPSSHQLGHVDQSIHRNRSPSLTQQFQQQYFGRRTSTQNTTSTVALPPMPASSHSGAPQLPSLPGLPPPPDMRFTLHSQGGGPPPVHPTPQGSGPTASSPGYHSQSGNNSLSSQSGEGSQLPYGQGGDRLWAYIRSLEVKIDRLQEEVGTLKAQLSAPR